MAIAGSAAAQQPPRRPAAAPHSDQEQPAASEAPQRTTATYDDWVVQCETPPGSPPQKVCEMAQVTQLQGKNLPFSRIGIPRPVKGQPVKLIVQVPVNVSVLTNVRIRTDDSDPGVAAPFARCLPSGCFAEFEVKDDTLKKFRAGSGAGKLSFADAGGHEVVVPLSFKGFVQAYDALLKE
jgi:invasion protein IalB